MTTTLQSTQSEVASHLLSSGLSWDDIDVSALKAETTAAWESVKVKRCSAGNYMLLVGGIVCAELVDCRQQMRDWQWYGRNVDGEHTRTGGAGRTKREIVNTFRRGAVLDAYGIR